MASHIAFMTVEALETFYIEILLLIIGQVVVLYAYEVTVAL
jgi:hypothetical protein